MIDSFSYGKVERVDRAPGKSWTLGIMKAALKRKGINYRESAEFSSLSGVTIVVGETAVMGIKKDLDSLEKIRVIAHELGHIALGHLAKTSPRRPFSPLNVAGHIDPQEEQDVDIWASHLLVDRAIWEKHSKSATLNERIQKTAKSLNIPTHVVQTWLENQDVNYSESPEDWFKKSKPWYEVAS